MRHCAGARAVPLTENDLELGDHWLAKVEIVDDLRKPPPRIDIALQLGSVRKGPRLGGVPRQPNVAGVGQSENTSRELCDDFRSRMVTVVPEELSLHVLSELFNRELERRVEIHIRQGPTVVDNEGREGRLTTHSTAHYTATLPTPVRDTRRRRTSE